MKKILKYLTALHMGIYFTLFFNIPMIIMLVITDEINPDDNKVFVVLILVINLFLMLTALCCYKYTMSIIVIDKNGITDKTFGKVNRVFLWDDITKVYIKSNFAKERCIFIESNNYHAEYNFKINKRRLKILLIYCINDNINKMIEEYL